jgi:hypothetical protein
MADQNGQNDPTVDLQTIDPTADGSEVSMGETTAFAADVDSGSTEADAGVLDPVSEALRQPDDIGASAELDEDEGNSDFEEDADLDVNLPGSPLNEIPLSSLDIESMDDPVTRNIIRSPDMDAPDLPGQVDIEGLGEDDLDLTDLPADARLDPLED